MTKFERIINSYIVAACALNGCVLGFCWGCHWSFSILGSLIGGNLGWLMVTDVRISIIEEKIGDLVDRAEAERRLEDHSETPISYDEARRSIDIDDTPPPSS